MTELQKYLAEEVAEDHADGIITRREAMRRLGLLGVGAAAASTMLAAEAVARTGGDHGHGRGAQSRPRAARALDVLGAGSHDADHVPGPERHADGGLGTGHQAARAACW